MKAIEIQKQMNAAYAKRNPNIKKVYSLYVKMNEARVNEGMPVLVLHNLEARFNSL